MIETYLFQKNYIIQKRHTIKSINCKQIIETSMQGHMKSKLTSERCNKICISEVPDCLRESEQYCLTLHNVSSRTILQNQFCLNGMETAKKVILNVNINYSVRINDPCVKLQGLFGYFDLVRDVTADGYCARGRNVWPSTYLQTQTTA